MNPRAVSEDIGRSNSEAQHENSGASFHGLPSGSGVQYIPQNTLISNGNPDGFIQDIPIPEQAIGDFNGAPFNRPPFRDVPSILIAHIGNPNTSLPEPDWPHLLEYFSTSRANHGVGNLQDLYMFVTRLAVPNAIIMNRRMLLDFYLSFRHAPPNLRIRYDSWMGNDYTPPNTEQVSPVSLGIPVRPILRDRPTPNGSNLIQWLESPPNTPPSHQPAPIQMRHHRTQLDLYLAEDEMAIRTMHPRSLLNRTARVLHIFWWLMSNNSRLTYYRLNQWAGMQEEIISG